MDTRMNKYYNEDEELTISRSKKNEELYKEISKNELDNYEVKSNSTILGETKAEIDVEKIKKILDTKYNEVPKRKSIRLENDEEIEEEKEITKEYDINVVLEKAKENKKENYEEERLKKLRNTQYDILNSLSIKKEEENKDDITSKKNNEIESLVNTIAFNEKNSKNNIDLDLLSDLKGDDNTEVLEGLKEETEDNTESNLKIDDTDNKLLENTTEKKNEKEETEDLENLEDTEDDKDSTDELEKTKLMDSFYTSSNALVKKDFDDDADFAKEINNGNTFIKIAIVIVSIIFIIGLVLIIKALFFS